MKNEKPLVSYEWDNIKDEEILLYDETYYELQININKPELDIVETNEFSRIYECYVKTLPPKKRRKFL
jgi:hypothetical protein